MGLQLSLRKKDKNPKYPGAGYPPYPGMPVPYGNMNAYWPGAGYNPVPVVPGNYNVPGFIPPALPWPANQTTHKRRRKRGTKTGRRRKRSNTDTMTNLPAGFVPNGFIPRSRDGEDPTRMPQPVIPGPISRAFSQGQPPPLFTPGNNAQQLAIFSSPQIPAPRAGSSHGHGSNLRAATPFIRSRQTDDDDDDDEEDDSDDDGPVIPSMLDQRGHRRAATMPAMQMQMQPFMLQRRNNPLPQPPRSFDRTPFKRLADLPHFEVPTQTTIVQMIQPEAGLAGIGANGAVSTQPKKSRLLRALSLRGNRQSGSSKSNTAAGAAVPITRIVPVIVSSQHTAGPSSAGSAGTNAHNLTNSTRPANTGNLTHSTSPTNLSTQSSPEPPLLFKNRGPYRAFVPFSEHAVVYQGKAFPTAQHLFEAKRFPENQQESWELIRTSKTVNEIYENASKLCQRGLERQDWSVIFLREMEEVLYLKLIQHEPVRNLLLRTGNVPLVYCANDPYWGNGEDEHGANKLGEVLQRLRDRLRSDGYA